jgi:glycosyltransferase involved in cell wall biosynthesis
LLSISRKHFTNFICCSNSVYQSLPNWFIKKNVSVIRHGINLDRIKIQSINKKNQIIVATRIIKQKNIKWIINGFAQSLNKNSYKLIIAGDGKLKNELEGMVKEIGMGNHIKFLGSCSREDVLTLMSESKFYISSSESDGMPIAVLEAVSSGSIPILLETPPHLEVLGLGIFGFSFKDMKKDISKAISQAMRLNKEELNLYAHKNINLSKREFGIDSMMNQYMQL